MKILLVGNYPYQKSQSMDRFASLLYTEFKVAGHQVSLLKPQPVIGRLYPSATGLGKWLGYFDRFLFFHSLLKQATDWADVVHICDHANSVYVPWLNGKAHVVTCHDMLAIRSALGEMPEASTRLLGHQYQRMILRGLQQADHIICVSEATKSDLQRIAGVNEKRVTVISNGINYPYFPMCKAEARDILKGFGNGCLRPFFMHVGGNEWYKNREGVLRLFLGLVHDSAFKNHLLIMAGKPLPCELKRLIHESGLAGRVVNVVNPTNEQLCALYSQAEALLFPSLYEGFGWPIIEAQACGCPVFTSNRPPMTYVGGEAACYIDPSAPIQAAFVVTESLQDRMVMCDKGLENVRRFDTQTMVNSYLEEYRNLL